MTKKQRDDLLMEILDYAQEIAEHIVFDSLDEDMVSLGALRYFIRSKLDKA